MTSIWAHALLDLSLARPADAHRRLGPLVERVTVAGIGEPGSIRFVVDDVEALVALGELDAAAVQLERFEKQARGLGRRSALAAAHRCRGLLAAAAGAAGESLPQLFNRDHVRWGHLFGARYSSKPIETEEHLFEALRYVILNPVRAGARRRPEEWPWATYRALMGLEPEPDFFDVDFVLRLFAPTREEARRALREFVNGPLAVDMSA